MGQIFELTTEINDMSVNHNGELAVAIHTDVETVIATKLDRADPSEMPKDQYALHYIKKDGSTHVLLLEPTHTLDLAHAGSASFPIRALVSNWSTTQVHLRRVK